MASAVNPREVGQELRRVRQVRQFQPGSVPGEVVTEILNIARWTGSSRNTQPWHFIVVTDKDKLQQISQLRPAINWVAAAPLGIAIVLDGDNEMSEVYDEGRVTERIMIGARINGFGAGVAWYGDASQQQQAKEILGIPAERLARSIVAIGPATTSKDPRPNPAQSGRRPLSEIVSYNRFGASDDGISRR